MSREIRQLKRQLERAEHHAAEACKREDLARREVEEASHAHGAA